MNFLDLFCDDFNSFFYNKIESYSFYPGLKNSLLYSIKAGGKRLRPFINAESGKFFNMNKKTNYEIGSAIELFHTSSLIHDDLPAIDNSDLRRKIPTNHKHFNEYTAILSGDYGFIFPAKIVLDADIKPENKVEVLKYFNDAFLKVIDGEMADVVFEKENIDPELKDIEKMYEYKTGALFGLSFCSSAAACGDFVKAESLYRAGIDFGVAFQIYDDIKDLVSTSEDLGKDTGKDENKKTISKIIGLEESKKYADKLFDSTLNKLNSLNFFDLSSYLNQLKELIEKK